jgi:hypothetical protein
MMAGFSAHYYSLAFDIPWAKSADHWGFVGFFVFFYFLVWMTVPLIVPPNK